MSVTIWLLFRRTLVPWIAYVPEINMVTKNVKFQTPQ